MNTIHTLSAYRISFAYKERSNPKREELKDKIANGEKPTVDLKWLLDEIILASKNLYQNNGGAMILRSINKIDATNEFTRFYFIPEAGKSGRPFTVYKPLISKIYTFGSDSSSVYGNHMFIYAFKDSSYLICHRYSNSGCKTIFERCANDILKKEGIKINLSYIFPDTKLSKEVQPVKLFLSQKYSNNSSDIADHISKKERCVTVKQLTINLKAEGNGVFNNLVLKRMTNEMNKDDALTEIREEAKDDEYNEAKVCVAIGKSRKLISWDNLESIFIGKDITDEFHSLNGTFEEKLTKCADNYIEEIREKER